MNDLEWMKQTLLLARQAQDFGEVPVGALIVSEEKKLLAKGHNQMILACDPSAHAEIVVLRLAAKGIKNYRLLKSTLYVSLEPCVMCWGAMIQARIKRLVYACSDPKTGAFSVFNLQNDAHFNHAIEVVQGPLTVEASQLLKDFFKERRSK